MEGEGRVGRSSLSRRVVVPVRQNATDGCGLGDESHDFHLGSASTGQRVDVVDFVNKLRPSLGDVPRDVEFGVAVAPWPA
jgi:hypothetical protein